MSSNPLDPYIPPIIQALVTLIGPTTAIIIASVWIVKRLGSLEGKMNVAKAELEGKMNVIDERAKNVIGEIDRIDKRITYQEQLKMAESPDIAKYLMKIAEEESKKK